MAKDGMTLKPGFQADSRQMIVIGGPVETYSLEYITENQLISPEFFKEEFINEAEIMGITTLEYKPAIVLECDVVNNSGTGQSTFEKHLKRLKELQQCKSCLEGDEGFVTCESCTKSHSPTCTENRSECHECKAKGHCHWNPMSRQCNECLETNSQSLRLVCFNLTTDSLQIFKTAMEMMSLGQANDTIPSEAFLASPNPDLVHAEKNIHRSHGNWFLYINQARFSLVMLRTARLDSAPAEPLKSALTDKALRGRDRMDTSYVAECTSRQV